MSTGSPRAMSPSSNDGGLPHLLFPRPSGPASIISSRMTDIASDDGEDTTSPGRHAQRRSLVTSESRPGTARTGASSSRGHRQQPHPLRKALANHRGSAGGPSIAGPTGRPVSTASRSHVPSLASQSFFRPMSSQKLQAQRGGPRPPKLMAPASVDEPTGDSPVRELTGAPANLSGLQQSSLDPHHDALYAGQPRSDDGSFNAPPSLGTEMTGPDTIGRRTANTSPTYGHFTQGSVSESVRPLQKNKAGAESGGNLGVNVDRGYMDRADVSGVVKSPRSFRSNFLLPGMSDGGQNGSGRGSGLEGAEKLSSGASSQHLGSPRRGGTPNKAAEPPPRPSRVGRVFEYFEGNTVFCLGGRWQNARQQPVNVATGLFVVVPAALFFAFSAPDLWREVSPAIPITFAYLAYICFSSFIHASVSDPGILPRSLHKFPPAEHDDPLRLGPPTTDWYLVRSADKSSAAMEVPVKHCRTCNIWRPPRAHHCRLCDNCIETHDHHCVWLNNCVGRRNYRYFFAFVTSSTLLGAYLAGASLAQVLLHRDREGVSFGSAVDRLRVPFAMVIYGLVAFLYPVALMTYHVFLMARGETTREYINSHKFVRSERYRAFTQGGWLRNWAVVLCRPRPPTYYHFKKPHVPGDQRLAAEKGRGGAARDDETVDVEMRVKGQDGGFEGPASMRSQEG